ncbi:hypothetical protein [Bradyrhizobium altum]|uniref:hypothetical protein n=1 Tax=Bradyrhizobium altum TaxID=1571202 RepID=UPI00289D9567|nr:hypothetical protein [Bradyrhizobium altum]
MNFPCYIRTLPAGLGPQQHSHNAGPDDSSYTIFAAAIESGRLAVRSLVRAFSSLRPCPPRSAGFLLRSARLFQSAACTVRAASRYSWKSIAGQRRVHLTGQSDGAGRSGAKLVSPKHDHEARIHATELIGKPGTLLYRRPLGWSGHSKEQANATEDQDPRLAASALIATTAGAFALGFYDDPHRNADYAWDYNGPHFDRVRPHVMYYPAQRGWYGPHRYHHGSNHPTPSSTQGDVGPEGNNNGTLTGVYRQW